MSTAVAIPNTSLAQESWLLTRDALAQGLAGVQAVTSQADVDRAGPLVTEAKRAIKALSAERLAFTRQLDDAKRAVMAQEAELSAPLATELARVEGLTAKYLTDQARAAEEARRAELARIEAENRRRAQEAAEAERKRIEAERAAFAANQPQPPPLPPVQAVLEAPPPPPVVAPKAEGARVRKRWTTTIAAPAEVPRALCVPDTRLVNAERDRQIAAGMEPAIPGCTFAWMMVPEGR